MNDLKPFRPWDLHQNCPKCGNRTVEGGLSGQRSHTHGIRWLAEEPVPYSGGRLVRNPERLEVFCLMCGFSPFCRLTADAPKPAKEEAA